MLEEKIYVTLVFAMCLDKTSKANPWKKSKLHYIKLKHTCFVKDTVKSMKKQAKDLEKISKYIYKDLLKLNTTKMSKPNYKKVNEQKI